MTIGRIVRLCHDRGFGFVQCPSGIELIFRLSDVRGVDPASLAEGDRIEFDVETTLRGLVAVSLHPPTSQTNGKTVAR